MIYITIIILFVTVYYYSLIVFILFYNFFLLYSEPLINVFGELSISPCDVVLSDPTKPSHPLSVNIKIDCDSPVPQKKMLLTSSTTFETR